MPFVLLFIYFNYMIKAGYDVLVFDWVCLFLVGLIQLMAWFVRVGLITSIDSPPDDGKAKHLDEWFRK